MKIHIPKPCHENWNEMTANEKGRFCDSCSQIVTDFTNSTEEEIDFAMKSNSKICGRFRENQLQQNFSLWSRIAFSLLFVGTATSMVNAQEVKGDEVKKIDFKKGLHGVEVINDTINKTMWLGMPSEADIESTKPKIYLDGKKISEKKMKKLKAENIKSVQVLSGEGAKKLYGKESDYGVIVIKSKTE